MIVWFDLAISIVNGKQVLETNDTLRIYYAQLDGTNIEFGTDNSVVLTMHVCDEEHLCDSIRQRIDLLRGRSGLLFIHSR